MSWSSRKKKGAFFVPFILCDRNFFNICVLSQCIVYSIHLRNVCTFIYQTNITSYIFLLVLKAFESFQCILKPFILESNIHRLNKNQIQTLSIQWICFDSFEASTACLFCSQRPYAYWTTRLCIVSNVFVITCTEFDDLNTNIPISRIQ